MTVSHNRTSRIISIAIISIILLIVFTILYTNNGLKRAMAQKEAELKTVTDFKTTQINDWLKERYADAHHFSSSPLYADAIKELINSSDSAQRNKILIRNELIRKLRGFMDVQIAVNHRSMPMSTTQHFDSIPDDVFPLIDSCMVTNQIVLSDFIKDHATGKKYFTTVAPITDASGSVFATLIFYIDPETYLNPLLRYSPGSLKSLNTTIIGLSGMTTFNPQAMDAGETSTTKKAFANRMTYQHPIEMAPWVIVSQLNKGAIQKEFYTQSIPIFIISTVTVLLIVLSISFLDQRYEKKTVTELLVLEQQTSANYQKSEARFRAVVENSNDAVLFLTDEGIISYCSASIEQVIGLKPDQLIRQHLLQFVCNNCVNGLNELLSKTCLSDIPTSARCMMLNTNNQPVWIELTLNNQLKNEHLRAIVANIKNIQQEKNHEQEIDNLLQFKSAILDNAGYAIITSDINGIITLFNKTAETILGYRAEELIGIQSASIFHLQDEIESQAKYLSEKTHQTVNADFSVFCTEAMQGIAPQYEWTYLRKDGSTFPVNLKVTTLKNQDGQTTGFMGIAIDISEIKTAEKKFSFFYQLSPDIVGITQLSTGMFIDINPAFSSLTGYSNHETVGKTSLELNIWGNPNDRNQLIAMLNKDNEVSNFEILMRTKTGQILTTLFSARKINFNNEDCMLFVVRDITQRKKDEEEIIQNESRLKSMVNIMQYPFSNATDFLDFTLNEALALTKSDIGFIFNYDEKTQEFNLSSWSKSVMAECAVGNPMTCYALEKTGLWGEVVRQRTPILINDFVKDNPHKKGYPTGHVALHNFMSVPIFADNKIVAVIGVANKSGDYNNTDILQLTLLMDTAWTMIEKDRVQQELKISEVKYRTLFENMSSGLILQRLVYDNKGEVVDFQFEEVNSVFGTIYNTNHNTLKEKYYSELHSGSPDWQWLHKLGKAERTGNPIQMINYDARTDKHIEITMYRYSPGYVVTIANDVTTRIVAEKELKQSEEKLSIIYAMVPDAIGMTREADGKLIDGNPSYTRLTGYTPNEYLGKTTTELNLWANIEDRKHMMDVLDKQQEVVNYMVDMRIKDGSILNCAFSMKKVHYSNEDCLLFVIHDITQIRATQKALFNEQSFTNALLDSIPGLVYMYDENGQLVRWNKKHVTQTGYSNEELSNKSIVSWYDDKNFKIIEKGIEGVHTIGYGEAEAYLTHRDGSQHLYYFSAAKSLIENKTYLAGIALDITERRATNESLRQVEQRFMNIYNLSPDMVGITRMSDGKILSGNPAFANLTGFTSDEFMGHTTLELGLWANPSYREIMIQQIKARGEVTNLEFVMKIKNGTLLTCLFSARPLVYNDEPSLLFVVHDISERKKHEEQLRISRDRLEKAQTVGHIGYAVHDLITKQVWASSEAKRIFGFDSQEGYLDANEIIKCIIDPDSLLDAMKRMRINGKKLDVVYQINPADGSEPKYIHSIQEMETNDKGEPCRVIDVFQDITERKLIELEVRHINENLEKTVEARTAQLAQVNKDLEAFAYSVSHDLRAPIRHIDGFFKLLYAQISEPTPTMVSYNQKITAAAQRMSSMIDELLAFSRLGRKDVVRTRVDMKEIIGEIIDQFTPELSSRHISWHIHHLPVVEADRSLLKTAFENLIGNAIKYTRNKEEAIIEIGETEDNTSQTQIFIKDNGVGFDMAYESKLFGVFQRLHSNEEFEGTGIGLANVKQIVTKHGGSISAIGKMNEGATFYVTLPK